MEVRSCGNGRQKRNTCNGKRRFRVKSTPCALVSLARVKKKSSSPPRQACTSPQFKWNINDLNGDSSLNDHGEQRRSNFGVT